MQRDVSICNFKSQIFNFRSQIPNLQLPSIRRPARRGFTLVEILVVISIIGLLVGLLLPVIATVQRRVKIARITMEMKQMMIALEDFRTKVGGSQYPPDGTNTADLQQFCKAAWSHATWSSAATPPAGQVGYPTDLTPDTALVFWLGGAQDASGAFIGFSANPLNPFDANAQRITPAYDFQQRANSSNPRFVQQGSLTPAPPASASVVWNLYQYLPLNGQPTSQPYLYFKAVAGQYSTAPFTPKGSVSIATQPYADSSVWTTKTPYYVSPKSYQILCPGMDGKFGKYATANTPPLYPAGTNYDQANGLDDMASFTNNATVGDDVP